jgi:ketosteroid isomerase-like protein
MRQTWPSKDLTKKTLKSPLSQDLKGLADVWAEDGVRITPGNPPTVGKAAIAAENEKGHAEHPEFKVLKYAPDVKNLQIAIADGWAIEVGSMEATYRLSAKDNPVNVNDKGMRLLKRQSDGSWKFALVGLK